MTKRKAKPTSRAKTSNCRSMFNTPKRLSQKVSEAGVLRVLYANGALGSIRSKVGTLLTCLFPKDATWVRVHGGALRGYDLYVELRHGEKSYWLGMFELDLQSAIRTLAEERPQVGCIYDVGAHIGFFSMVLAHCFQSARVYAFEPNPRNYKRLTINIGRNGLVARINPVDRAVSDESHQAQFYVGGSSWSGSLIRNHRDDYETECNVQTISLDEAVFRDHYPAPDLIKIDVEGAEAQVLRGGIRVLEDCKPTLIIEVHYPWTGEQVVSLLKRMGYHISSLAEETELAGNLSSPGHILARHKSL